MYHRGMNNDRKSPHELVTEFHETYGMSIRHKPELDIPERELRMKLIREEFNELSDAYDANDFIEMVDAWCDLIYVIYGAGLAHGVDLDEVLQEVQRSNMSKLGADGKPIYREDGKVMKGPNFSKPDIKAALIKLGYEPTERTNAE